MWIFHYCTCSMSVNLEDLHNIDMSSKEDVEEQNDYHDWCLGEDDIE